MQKPEFNIAGAIFWGGLVAGILDIAAVLAYWLPHGATTAGIFQAIASSLMGPAAYEAGSASVALGAFLHFAVSFVFAAAWVGASVRLAILRVRPVICGMAYGLLAWIIMTHIVVPLSRADFGESTPVRMAISIAIHVFLFGLPIALAASLIRTGTIDHKP